MRAGTMISGLPRTTSRAVWYALYRVFRIAAREAARGAEELANDLMIYGTAVAIVEPADGPHGAWARVRRVDLRSVMKET